MIHGWYGQNGEDKYLAEYLDTRKLTIGRVLDLGAHDGLRFSNTAKLLEVGWGGTLVECSPKPLGALLDRYGRRPDITVVGACIEAEAAPPSAFGFTGLSDSNGEMVSTTVDKNREIWKRLPFRTVWIPVVPIAQLLGAFPGPYDVISIDIEGQSTDVFCAMPVELLSVASFVIVEHDDQVVRIIEHGVKAGLTHLLTNQENVLMTRGEA